MEQNQIVLRKEDFVEKDGIFWMPIRELARHLGYKNERKLKHLYSRHVDELKQYSGVSKMDTPAEFRKH